MKIGFLLCSPEINGGTNVILEHAAGLREREHEVDIITDRPVAPGEYGWHPRGARLSWVTSAAAQTESYDCLIATWWESPYLLHLYNAAQYVYFVQSIESRFFQQDDPADLDLRDHSIGASRCDHSYYFSLPMITEATWISHYLKEHCNQNPYLVRNGIRKEMYAGTAAIEKKPPNGLRVLVEGPVEVFHKNVPRTIELCREAGVEEVWLLTTSEVTTFDGVDRVFSQIPLERTPPVYRSCHALVKLSGVEGMFGPPLEMFHCGGTAIVYDVTGHDEYIEHDVNGLVADHGDEARVVEYLKQLGEDAHMLDRLCRGARDTATKWHDWHQSSTEFEQALQAIMHQPRVSRRYLENISALFMAHQSLQLESRDLQRHAEREGSPAGTAHHNFVQAYAYGSERLVGQNWRHYLSGSAATLQCTLAVDGEECQVRLDPSVRIGIVCLHEIVLRSDDNEMRHTFSPANFDRLFVTGTAQWLRRQDDFWVIHAYGNDPQIFLPKLQSWSGDTVTIEVTLRELGVKEFIRELEDQSSSGGKGGLLSSLRTILRP